MNDPIKTIDKVLNLLATDVALKPHATVSEIMDQLKRRYPELVLEHAIVDDFGSEVTAMVEKLVKDDYVMPIDSGSYERYKITFEGKFCNLRGGYGAAIEIAQHEKKIQNLKDFFLIIGTWIAGVGTISLVVWETISIITCISIEHTP